MRRDRPLAPGARQTDTVRAQLHKLLAFFPDPQAHMDPLEKLEQACADVTLRAQQVLSAGGNHPHAHAEVRLKLLALLAWADSIEWMARATDSAIRRADRAVDAPAKPSTEPAAFVGNAHPGARKNAACGDFLLWVSKKVMRRG